MSNDGLNKHFLFKENTECTLNASATCCIAYYASILCRNALRNLWPHLSKGKYVHIKQYMPEFLAVEWQCSSSLPEAGSQSSWATWSTFQGVICSGDGYCDDGGSWWFLPRWWLTVVALRMLSPLPPVSVSLLSMLDDLANHILDTY